MWRGAPRISIKFKPTGEEVMRNTPSTKVGARVQRRSGVAGLHVVLRLEELAVDPGKTGVLDAHTTELLETAAIAALDALRKRKLILPAEASVVTQARCPDRLLRPKEVAARLGMGVDWVYQINTNCRSECRSVQCRASPREASTISSESDRALERFFAMSLTRR